MRPIAVLILLLLCRPALAERTFALSSSRPERITTSSTTTAGPHNAVVRLTSHGCSGTVIYTATGKTIILTCAHGFQGRDRSRPITIDAPYPSVGAVRTGGIRILRCGDPRTVDLCLIEVGYGPLQYVCPVAPAGHRPGRVWSAGYDEMKPAVTVRTATLIGSSGNETFTRESPWHGRSGGALLDPDRNVLLGTVIGYETGPGRRPVQGIYTSHAAVLRFVGYTSRPATSEQRECPCGPGCQCAPGQCPNCPTGTAPWSAGRQPLYAPAPGYR